MVRFLIAVMLLLSTPLALVEAAIAVAAPGQEIDSHLFSAGGYRIDRYRSPTPAQAAGATTVSTGELQQLLADTPSPVVLDVINLEYRAGRFLQTEPHPSLPTAIWLPNTGRGDLAPEWHRYLINNTLALVDGNRDHPVVVLCKSDCWLSWNAVKRLAEAGFRKLYWYRDGVDGWANAGLPMQLADPVAPDFPSPAHSANES